MSKIKIFRLLFIRYHYLRFGINGIKFYFKANKFKNDAIASKNELIVFKHSEFKHPIKLRNHTSDIDVFYQVLFNRSYEIKKEIKPTVIFDCGANIGLTSIFFSNEYPDATIIAIEPESSNYKLLVENTKYYNNIICYNNAIWSKPDILSIRDNGIGNCGFSVNEIESPTENYIEAITISDIINKYNLKTIDILKVDIEGSEFDLFSSNYESWLSITKMIIIEPHDSLKPGSSKQIFSTLIKYNFELSLKGEDLVFYLEK